ncbi:MAG: TIGR04086 family membrane protein [Mollicutes bacterium]|nr:TIGR04086 family membrane protein [Mollicutes bacterium]
MLFLKNCLKPLLYIIGSILILTLIVTILNYFNVINYQVVTIIKFIIPIISLFIGGILIGKRSHHKGWLAGLKLAIIFLFILFLFNYLGLNHKIKLTDLIYYLIFIISTMFGSVIGINSKKEEKENR